MEGVTRDRELEWRRRMSTSFEARPRFWTYIRVLLTFECKNGVYFEFLVVRVANLSGRWVGRQREEESQSLLLIRLFECPQMRRNSRHWAPLL